MNYGELKAAIQGYLHRDDMQQMIVSSIALAAVRIGRDLRHRSNMELATFSTDDGGLAFMPDRLREIQTISYPAGNFSGNLQLVSEQEWGEVQAGYQGYGAPAVWCASGGIIKVAPVNTETEFNVIGWFQPKELVDDADINNVLVYCPQVYVYGALMDLFFYTQDGDLTAAAKRQYFEEIERLNAESKAESTGINPRMRRVQ